VGGPLRVLLVEDSPDDAELVLRELRRGGFQPTWERVEDPAGMVAALERASWDVVIADHQLPRFSAPAALELLKQRDLDVPFLVVSGSIGEEEAVAAMRAGARDYLMKDKLARLVATVERELREAKARRARRETEDQLQHAQRMEAIGQLTGGVAHDFNNLLTVVIGNLELLERQGGDDPRLPKRVAAALRAANRGAELTQRLLAFARRQTLQPQALDVNHLVRGTLELMERTLGSAICIQVVLVEDLWPALADAGQLENSLINLAVNARDAMPQGGTLTIETANAELEPEYAAAQVEVVAGGYMMLSITDTGVGMSPEVAAKAFEPFYTTKEIGKGTGLGLSMVHGFVKQSRGHIRIYSELGCGTTVRMYLPKAGTHEGVAEPRPQGEVEASSRGETILLVEDEADVREVALTFLGELGYRVLAAENGPAALEVLGSNAEVDLLLTDIVMPGGMSGHELARKVLERHPGMPVVYCSGYSEAAVFRERALGSRERFLVKPYSRKALARTVREALESEVKE